LPQPIPGRHHPNELDRLLYESRVKVLKQINLKCDKLPNADFNEVIEELETCVILLKNIEKEVFILIINFIF
jgi:hypothetical protein